MGYTERETGKIRVPTAEQIVHAAGGMGLRTDHLASPNGKPSALLRRLLAYYGLRATTLNERVEPLLMDASKARREFEQLKKKLKPSCPLPLNKQKGEKRAPAYFTGIINMLIEAGAGEVSCDFDPRTLTSITKNGRPVRTFARRVDGAFPSALNPVALWETKEYYYTTTFGSRVADGVYESLLDGMELLELRQSTGIRVLHYLFIDGHYTWWKCGKSYLCRIFDMLHMGLVDEVLVGCEVVERLPVLVSHWMELHGAKG